MVFCYVSDCVPAGCLAEFYAMNRLIRAWVCIENNNWLSSDYGLTTASDFP